MSFDINEVLSEMLLEIQSIVSDNWDEVKSPASRFLQNRKERLELLSRLRIENDLTQEKFESYIMDEKLILEAELHAIALVSKAIAQRATNAAIDVLVKAVKTILMV